MNTASVKYRKMQLQEKFPALKIAILYKFNYWSRNVLHFPTAMMYSFPLKEIIEKTLIGLHTLECKFTLYFVLDFKLQVHIA